MFLKSFATNPETGSILQTPKIQWRGKSLICGHCLPLPCDRTSHATQHASSNLVRQRNSHANVPAASGGRLQIYAPLTHPNLKNHLRPTCITVICGILVEICTRSFFVEWRRITWTSCFSQQTACLQLLHAPAKSTAVLLPCLRLSPVGCFGAGFSLLLSLHSPTLLLAVEAITCGSSFIQGCPVRTRVPSNATSTEDCGCARACCACFCTQHLRVRGSAMLLVGRECGAVLCYRFAHRQWLLLSR